MDENFDSLLNPDPSSTRAIPYIRSASFRILFVHIGPTLLIKRTTFSALPEE
jgi:hypothetical protein